MKIYISYPECIISVEINDVNQLKTYRNYLNDPTSLIRVWYYLKIKLERSASGQTRVWQNSVTQYWYVNGTAKAFKTVEDAVTYLFESKVKIKANKMYRFNYSSGTRAGQKRAVIIDEVDSTYIQARDLDTNMPKRYLVSKVSELEEIK